MVVSVSSVEGTMIMMMMMMMVMMMMMMMMIMMMMMMMVMMMMMMTVSYIHLRAHETPEHLVSRLLLEKKNYFQHTNFHLNSSLHTYQTHHYIKSPHITF